MQIDGYSLDAQKTKMKAFCDYNEYEIFKLSRFGRNAYRQVKKDDYLLVDGLHEALVSEEVWEQAQVKVAT